MLNKFLKSITHADLTSHDVCCNSFVWLQRFTGMWLGDSNFLNYSTIRTSYWAFLYQTANDNFWACRTFALGWMWNYKGTLCHEHNNRIDSLVFSIFYLLVLQKGVPLCHFQGMGFHQHRNARLRSHLQVEAKPVWQLDHPELSELRRLIIRSWSVVTPVPLAHHHG